MCAANPHASFGTAPQPPTAEEVMAANPDDGTTKQLSSSSKLASFGKFWQGIGSGSQDDNNQANARRTTVSHDALTQTPR